MSAAARKITPSSIAETPSMEEPAAGDILDGAHTPDVGHSGDGAVDPSPQPIRHPSSMAGPAGATSPAPILVPPASAGPAQESPPPEQLPTAIDDAVAGFDRDGWLRLRALADCYDESQLTRIALANRLRQFPALVGLVAAPETAEKGFARAMRDEYRATVPTPIRDWQKEQAGIGEHLLARLLGHLGHPVIAVPHHWENTDLVQCGPRCSSQCPARKVPSKKSKRHLFVELPYGRTLRQLWAYCGHGDPTRRRSANVVDLFAAGNPRLKMLAHLIAEDAIKQGGRTWSAKRGGYWDERELCGARLKNGKTCMVRAGSSTDHVGSGFCKRHDLPDAQGSHALHAKVGVGELLDGAQSWNESQCRHGAAEPSPAPIVDPAAIPGTAQETSLDAHVTNGSKTVDGVERPVWKYRLAYESARDRYATRAHETPCVRCGPSGKPAAEGSPWSMAHQHAAALRLVAKTILADLWRVTESAPVES